MTAEWIRANGQGSDGRNVQMTRKKLSDAAFALAACWSGALMSASAAQAAGFSAEYVFGDSLSDVGNVYLATSGIKPASPYVNRQFSNGPVWVQDLAGRLGLPALTPSLAGGSDYAFGGATTGFPSTNNPLVPNLTQQVDTFFSGHASAPSDALYTLSIGANDLFAILKSGLTPQQAAGAAAAAALVVASEAGDLAAAGAKDLVLFDVPDLGVTPQITALGSHAASAAATALSAYFDEQVLIDLAPVEAAGLTVFDLNTYALLDKAVQDPSAFGFSNVTAPCWTGGFTGSATGGSLCSTLPAVQDTYLFWDDVHPTAAGHLLVADAALSALGLPVPEPSTWAMLLVGFGGLGFVGYRARARAAA
jgi:phospholipase/lecithinase/hemolysin